MKMTAFKEHQKDSGDWFRELPNHWISKKAKWVFDNLRESFKEGDVQLAASQKYGVIPQKLMMEMNNANVMQAIKGTDNFKRVKNNDFVISLRSFEGGIEISHYDGCISPAYTVLRLSDKQENYPDYFRYALKESVFIQALNSTSEGIRDGKTITYSQFRSLNLCVPPFGEQKAISCFLNRETKRIDSLIDEKQIFINLLKEKRQTLISHVVTKGLDPDVEMKDSGVKWIGEIPKHWSIVPFRIPIQFQEGPGIMAVDFKDKGIPLIRISGVKTDTVKLSGCNYLDPSKVEKKWSHFKLNKGDLLISGSASMDVVSEVTEEAEGAIPYTGLIRLTPKIDTITKEYIKVLVSSDLFFTQIDLMKAGATIQHFGPIHLNRMKISLPSIEEQKQISDHIEKSVNKIEALISETSRSIELLKEHRTALISASVTGKIDLRDKEVA